MKFTIELGAIGVTKANWLIYTHFKEEHLDQGLEMMDENFADHEGKEIGPLAEIRNKGGLTGKLREVQIFRDFPHLEARHWLILGLGERDKLDLGRFNEALRIAVEEIATKKSQVVALCYPYFLQEQLGQGQALEELAKELMRQFQNPQTADGKTLHPFKQVKLLGPLNSPQNDAALSRGVEAADS